MGESQLLAEISSRRGVVKWAVAVIAVCAPLLSTATAAAAGASDFAVQEYREDFDVSEAKAEVNLATQGLGLALVPQLKDSLGDQYAGVWFDNEAGEYVIPKLPTVDESKIHAQLEAAGLGSAYRISEARTSWAGLDAAQNSIDRSLGALLREGLVQTFLDPRSNSVVVRQASGADESDIATIQRVVRDHASVNVDVRKRNAARLGSAPRACEFTPSICDQPLRGAMGMWPSGTEGLIPDFATCSVGFKALGSAGNRYVLTAGHCAEITNWQSYDLNHKSRFIGSVEQYVQAPTSDYAKIKANGSYWDTSPWPTKVAYWGVDQERPIYYEGYSYLGEYVCHAGANSGSSCASVTALDMTSPQPEGPIYHRTEFGQICSKGGDSGGPVFTATGNMALGLFTHNDIGVEGKNPSYCKEMGYYTEITEAADALGVSVGTRIGGPPPPPSEPPPPPTPIQGEDDNFGGGHPVVQSSGAIDVFYRTPSGGLGHNWFSTAPLVKGWHLENLEGSLASSSVPHPVVQDNGSIDVFYRTPSGGLGHNWFSPAPQAEGWHLENLTGSVAGDPHPVVQDNGAVDVFYRTPSGGLGHNWFRPDLGWHLENLEGSVASDPYPVVRDNGNLDVFYRTPSGGLGHNWFSPDPLVEGWHLENLEGSLASSSVPHPVVQPDGDLDVFYRTPSGGLGHNWFSPALQGQGWHLENLSGSVASDPHAVVQPDGDLDVFYRTPSGGLGHNWYSSAPLAKGWHQENLSGSVAGDPYPVVQPDGDIDVFYRTPTGGLGHNWFGPDLGWHLENLEGSVDLSAGTGVHATTLSTGAIDVFYRTPSGGLGHNWFSTAQLAYGWHKEDLEGSVSPAPPAATTQAATNLKTTEATLNATVNPEGGATSYYFQYGTTTSYGSKKPAVAAGIGSGTANVAVAQTATALAAKTTYHFRVVAESAGGTTYGADKTFTTPASEYAAAVGADNPVSYWRLGETSGTTAADERGANPGTYTNAPTLGATSLLAADTANKAVGFDGVNDHVKVANSASLGLTSSLSLEAWIKPTSLPASGVFASILTKPESYSLQFNGPLLEFTIMQSGARKRLQAPSGTIVAGQTYHVVATYDGTTQRLYVNGTQVASTALSGAATVNTNSLAIGSWNGLEEFFKGTIDEPAVYNSTLSAARVSAHYQAGS
jgi:Concanavalin A-like lectin/glucanases superfamily